jgi:hypothetical protein
MTREDDPEDVIAKRQWPPIATYAISVIVGLLGTASGFVLAQRDDVRDSRMTNNRQDVEIRALTESTSRLVVSSNDLRLAIDTMAVASRARLDALEQRQARIEAAQDRYK